MDGEATLQRMLNTIHHGDCVAGMNALPAGCVDLAFADPPFNIGYEYDVYEDRKERDHYLAWSRDWISAVHRVLKPTGTFWLAIGDEYAAELKVLSQDIGFHCRSWVIWYYTFGVNCKLKFSRSHAHLFHFVKDPKKFTFRSENHRIYSARQLVYNDNRADPTGRLPDDTWILRPQDLTDCFTPSEDTWYFPRVAGTFKERAGFHGCQMPEQLLGRIVSLCSHTDDAVLDPFSGSATTLVVAKKLGRSFLGFELSADYVTRGSDRLAQARRGDPLEGAAEPLVSAPKTPRGAKKGTPRVEGRTRDPSAEALFEEGLIEAFRRVSNGFSLDRVIADPELNQQLADQAVALGLPGDRRTWNRRLFNCRKAGKLVGIPTDKRTQFNWQHCDPYLFASEIALAQMINDGAESLDEVLCDPLLAEKFDEIAQRFEPGFSSLEYRWAALKLRKEAKLARARSEVLKENKPLRLNAAVQAFDFDLHAIPDKAGVYLVTGGGRAGPGELYVGETLNLRQRLGRQFQRDRLNAWLEHSSEQELRVRTLAVDPSPPMLLAYESLLIQRYKPALNFKELGAA